MTIKAMQTEYNGYKFRSRLEARWAVFFDTLGIPYEYEPEGYEFDGQYYLPDFYLPDSKQYFEVKGVMSDSDLEKCRAFGKAIGKDVVIGYPEVRFSFACIYECEEANFDPGTPVLACCPICEKYYFLDEIGTFKCRCCGAYDGDHYYRPVMHSACGYFLQEFRTWEVEEAVKAFKQARFEYDETPTPPSWCA